MATRNYRKEWFELLELGAWLLRTIQRGNLSIVARLSLPEQVYSALMRHLLPPRQRAEEAAFVFARFCPVTFEFVDWYAVPITEFVHRSLYHIELSDRCRATTIKRAHDLDCSIVEFHSHPLSAIASFSLSDSLGLSEYVPHVFWRLKGRPYAAVVVTLRGFDSLAWLTYPNSPAGTLEIVVGSKVLSPTGVSFIGGDHANASREI